MGEARGIGLIGGIEIVRNKATREQFDPALKANAQITAKCQAHGLLLRPLPNDSIGICPPMIISEPARSTCCSTGCRLASTTASAPCPGGLSGMAPQPHPWLMPLLAADGRAWAGGGVDAPSRAGTSRAASGSGWPTGIVAYGVWDFFLSGSLPEERVMGVSEAVVAHYGVGDLLQRIDTALRESGKDPRAADGRRPRRRRRVPRARPGGDGRAGRSPAAGVDTELLDIGSGIGGPARFLAATRGHRVVGVDLTPEYVAVANELTRRCGLDDAAGS